MDKIITALTRAMKFQNCHQEEAFVKKILGYPDPIPILKTDDGLMFRQGRVAAEGRDGENQRTQKFTRRRPMVRPLLKIYLHGRLDGRGHVPFQARVRSFGHLHFSGGQ
uniref:Uncharacterized protein n=1 Tax=Desulfobacca acetoxidans TaxID=60893 RepID=A0A7V6A5D0_9BACT